MTTARWWCLAVAVAALSGCGGDSYPRSGSTWPDGAVKPGPFDPLHPGPNTTTKNDSRPPDRPPLDAGVADTKRSPDHAACVNGGCPLNQLCFERLSPFSATCIDMLPHCDNCNCMNPPPGCQCYPPPAPMILCPF